MSETAPETATPAIDPAVKESMDEQQLRLRARTRRLGGLIYSIARTLFRTLHISYENMQGLNPGGGGSILVTWHGRTLLPANVFRNRGYWALISLSRDGELQNYIFQRLGFQTIRGSTGRGGVRGALQMARKVKEGGVLAFTPDGPRGPTHKVQPGVVLMAEKSGAPIVPIGVSAGRQWLVNSWDSYMVPQPFARCHFLVGEPIYIPPKISDTEREAYCRHIEIAINRLEREAERRAGRNSYPAEWPTS